MEVIKIFVTQNPGMTFILLVLIIMGLVDIIETWSKGYYSRKQ